MCRSCSLLFIVETIPVAGRGCVPPDGQMTTERSGPARAPRTAAVGGGRRPWNDEDPEEVQRYDPAHQVGGE